MAVGIDDFGADFIHYLPGVIKMLPETVLAMKICKGKTYNWEGSRLQKHVHVGWNSAIGFATDGGAIPPSKKQTYVPAMCYRKFAVGSVGITDGILNNASTTRNSAVKVVDSELRGLMTGISKFYNYFWTRDGTGVVTTLGATLSGATITVRDGRGVWEGGDYSILDNPTVATVHAEFEVASKARAPTALGECTVTPTANVAAGGAAGDFIVWGKGGYRSYLRAITGLDAGIADGAVTFQGISAVTYPRYTSPVLDLGTPVRPLQPSHIRRMQSMITSESGREPADDMVVLTNVFGAVQMDELYEGQVRITPDTTTVGQKTPSIQSSLGKLTVVFDHDAPYGTMFFVDPAEITFAVQKELHWRPVSNGGGGILMRDNQNLGYVANAMEQSELFYEQRNRMGKIIHIAEDRDTAF